MREQKIGLVYRKNERKEIMKDWDYAKGMEIGQGNPGLGYKSPWGSTSAKSSFSGIPQNNMTLSIKSKI